MDLIDRLRTYASTRKGELAELITEAADALERQTCEDAVSRQAAIDAAKDWHEGLICGSVNGLIKKLKALPTVPPGAHEGKWVYGEDSTADCVDGYRCSQCGFFVPWDYNHKLIDYINDYAYCPNCGADMRGEKDEPEE